MNAASPTARPMPERRHRASWTLLAVSFLVVILGTLAPGVDIGWLREHVPLFAVAWDKLDETFPGFNPLHIIFYAWLAMVWQLLKPRWPRWRIPVILGVMGVLGEVGQIFIPGREPRVTDALNDWLGIAIGIALAMLVMRLARKR